MAAAEDPRIHRLQAENKTISDELAQCQADKEFVWTLWKRLQVANPDVTQAISLVVQREKEKAELKDRKILEILHVKDNRITELEQVLSQHQDEVKAVASRKFEVDAEKEVLSKENQLLKQQNEQLQNQMESTVSRLGSTETINKQLVDNVQKQKKHAEKKVLQLTADLEKFQEELQESHQARDELENQIKGLEKELRKTKSRSKKSEKQLTEEENQVHQVQEDLQQIQAELKAREGELKSTRKELSALQSTHSETVDQASGQADIIRQLQALQIDTQKVLKKQEDAHKLEVSSFQAMYKELQSRYNAAKVTEEQFKHQLSKAQKDLLKTEKQLQYRPDVRNVGIQVKVVEKSHSATQRQDPTNVLDRATHKQDPEALDRASHRQDPEALERASHRQDQEVMDMAWDLQSRGRRAASTPVKSSIRRARSLSPRMLSHRQLDRRQTFSRDDIRLQAVYNRYDVGQYVDEMEGDDVLSGSPEEEGAGQLGRISQDPKDRKLAALRKLLKLKNQELEEMRSAHNRRNTRVRVLQSSHNLLREQIKTYEAHESATGKQKKKKKARRSTDPKALQQENSEAVWNELAYYKQQATDAMQEKMNLEEEVDCMRVQTSSDASTIDELNICLQQERHDLQVHLSKLRKVNKREEKEREIIEELKQKYKALKRQKEELETQRKDINVDRTEMQKEIRVLKKDLSQLRAENMKKDSAVYSMKRDMNKLRRKLKHRHRHTVGSVSLSQSPQQHQAFLNKSIQEMRQVFPEFDQEDWQEISTTDSSSTDMDEVTESSLGHRIVASSSNTSTPKKSKTLKMRTPKRTGKKHPTNVSPRQLASIEQHLLRMARAYEETQHKEGRDSSGTSVATQTDRECTIRVKNIGVGDLFIGDNIFSSTSTDSSDSKTPTRGSRKTVDSRTIATSPHISLSKLSHAINRKNTQSSGTQSVSSLKQRVATLQHQVAVLREAKLTLQKTATEQQDLTEKQQEDLNSANQRLKLSKQTVQRLQSELQQNEQEKRSVEIQLEAKKTESDAIRHSETAWKQMENRIKSQSGEVGRQTAAIKALKTENDTHRESTKSLQDKVNRMERDVCQKRSLIEDLKGKATAAELRLRTETQNVEEVEEKLQYVTEQLDRKKAEIESLRKQLSVVTKEKHQYEQQWLQTQAEMDKQTHLIHEVNLRCNEAESTAAELESAASQQMRALARQTEGALQAANEKLKKSRKVAEELEIFVKELASEVLHQVQDSRLLLRQSVQSACEAKKAELREPMNSRAQSIASDLLAMSASDLDEFLTDDDDDRFEMEKQELENEKQDKKWSKRLTALLESKTPSSQDLLRLITSKITEKDNILKHLR